MKWTVEEMEKYESAKEYVDTAVIPVFTLDWGQVGSNQVREQRWLEEVCHYAERQLTGRVLLFPTFYAIQEEWLLPLREHADFPYVIFVTTNEGVLEQIQQWGMKAYLVPRKENEEDLTERVREGKKLTQSIMDHWKK